MSGHQVTNVMDVWATCFHSLGTLNIFLPARIQSGSELIDSVRGEEMLDGQDAGPNHSSFRPSF